MQTSLNDLRPAIMAFGCMAKKPLPEMDNPETAFCPVTLKFIKEIHQTFKNIHKKFMQHHIKKDIYNVKEEQANKKGNKKGKKKGNVQSSVSWKQYQNELVNQTQQGGINTPNQKKFLVSSLIHGQGAWVDDWKTSGWPTKIMTVSQMREKGLARHEWYIYPDRRVKVPSRQTAIIAHLQNKHKTFSAFIRVKHLPSNHSHIICMVQ